MVIRVLYSQFENKNSPTFQRIMLVYGHSLCVSHNLYIEKRLEKELREIRESIHCK